MDNYQPDVVVLDRGLDLNNAKIAIKPGSLLDCLNYEIVDRSGIKYIDGFERYDGHDSPSEYEAGDVEGLTAAAATAALNTAADTAREDVEALPSRAIGLHWFRDRLYAVVDEKVIYFSGGGTTEPFPNQLISAGTATGRILAITLRSGTWAGGDANGAMHIEDYGTGDWDAAMTAGATLAATAPVIADVATLRSKDGSDIESQYATLWQSRDSEIADDESASVGWDRTDCGWVIPFTDGNYFSGELVKIERGENSNNFEYGTGSTSVSGSNGLPLTVINGGGIADDFNPALLGLDKTGGPGWKTSANANGWATSPELLTAATTDDTTYAYASTFCGGNRLGFVTWESVVGTNLGINNQRSFDHFTSVYGSTPTGMADDHFSGYSRTPLILTNFAAIYDELPYGAVISGIELAVDYIPQVSILTQFSNGRVTRDGGTDVLAAAYLNVVKNHYSLNAYVGTFSEATNTFVPKGVKRTVRGSFSTTASDYSLVSDADDDTTTTAGFRSESQSTVTFGSSSDVWGAALTPTDFLNADFGVAFYAKLGDNGRDITGFPFYVYSRSSGTTPLYENGTVTIRTNIDKIRLKIYYTEPSARYYISDGAGGVCTGDLVNYIVVEGNIATGSGEGLMQLTNIQVVSGSKREVKMGDTIHLSASVSTADQVAVVSDGESDTGANALTYNGLASLDGITSAASRYEFITANYYGNDSWDGIYGVSGAGRAFTYDGTYFYHIYTQRDANKDKPRHIAYHHNHLALGYSSGTVLLSAIGQPDLFTNVAQASAGADLGSQIAIGDKITGMLPLRGAILAVYCENSIWGISGTSRDNFTPQVLAPTTGAIEYTVVDIGGMPVHCDSRGISTLAQSEKYGDFQGSRLSTNITSWLLPRLRKSTNNFSVADGLGVVCAMPVRSKNQYRVWFKDGKILTMTLAGSDMQPEFTFQRYFIGETGQVTDSTKYMVPIAWSSQVDHKGAERIHVSHYSTSSAVTEALGKYVYELDRGWSFDGNPIPAYFTLNWYYNKNPVGNTIIRKIISHGLSHGYSNAAVKIAVDLSDTYSTIAPNVSLPSSTASSFYTDFKSFETITSIEGRGRSFSLKFICTPEDPEPSHIYQVLIVSFTPDASFAV